MSKPTKEEMKKWLLDFDYKYYSIGLHFPQLICPPTERDKAMFKAIMDVIENMEGKRMSRDDIESIIFNEKTTMAENVDALLDYLDAKGIEVEEEK